MGQRLASGTANGADYGLREALAWLAVSRGTPRLHASLWSTITVEHDCNAAVENLLENGDKVRGEWRREYDCWANWLVPRTLNATVRTIGTP